MPLGFLLLLCAYCAGSTWVLLSSGAGIRDAVVGVCTVGVALYFGYLQWQLGQEMRSLSQEQGRLSEVMRLLTFAPVLTAQFPTKNEREIGAYIEVTNIGRGPAMDIRVCVWTKTGDSEAWREMPATSPADHLGPDEDKLRIHVDNWDAVRAGMLGPRCRKADVWIVHCGDQNGVHWHAWSNWSRETNEHLPTGHFFFESKFRTPEWVRHHCPRCKELPNAV